MKLTELCQLYIGKGKSKDRCRITLCAVITSDQVIEGVMRECKGLVNEPCTYIGGVCSINLRLWF